MHPCRQAPGQLRWTLAKWFSVAEPKSGSQGRGERRACQQKECLQPLGPNPPVGHRLLVKSVSTCSIRSIDLGQQACSRSFEKAATFGSKSVHT
mmetsp:Transcript_14457/g.19492  ORF Transcript_14457/g.19492 Transcript_14457/m.19492 type:complete len:94 (-) Transcript_14457:20-301(-)